MIDRWRNSAQHHVEPRARNHDITQRSKQREQVDRPRRPRILQHNEARPHRFRGVVEKRRQDHVLCAFDIDLDGVDRVDRCALQELQQGLCIDDGSISPRRFHDAGAAAIASINLERRLAGFVRQGNRSDADGYAGIDPDIERQTRQVFRVRLDRKNAGVSTGTGCDEEREQSDIGADIDKDETGPARLGPVDLGGELGPFCPASRRLCGGRGCPGLSAAGMGREGAAPQPAGPGVAPRADRPRDQPADYWITFQF